MTSSIPISGWTVALLLFGAWVISLGVRWCARRVHLFRHHERQRRAMRGERDAVDLLALEGYALLDSQVHGQWTIFVDDEPVEIVLCADHVVERDGCIYVAEVKTGRKAPSVRTARTRRQLLEYRCAFDVEGVLLVDMEEGVVRRIDFAV